MKPALSNLAWVMSGSVLLFMIPARLGLDLIVDVGVEVVATISFDARNSLDLKIGKEIWISFKASSCKIYK